MNKNNLNEENLDFENATTKTPERIHPEAKPEKAISKPAKKLAKVVGYDAACGYVVYEYDGKRIQINHKDYDGVSEYIEI